jgi:hypothetical protein
MTLFQQSVLKKYLADLPKLEVEAAFQRLTAHFGNPDIQENIRNAKEELLLDFLFFLIAISPMFLFTFLFL